MSSAGDRIISIECVLNSDVNSARNTSVFFQKFAFYMALPVLAVSCSWCFWRLVYYYKKLKLDRKPWNYKAAGLFDVINDGLIEHNEVAETLEALDENAEPMRVEGIIKYLNMTEHPARVEDFQDAWLRAYLHICNDNAILSVIVLLFMLHPNIAQYTFTVFTCEELRTDHFYLSEDLETECYTTKWKAWAILGGICIFVYTLGIPAFGFYVLHSVRNNLKDKHVKLKYGFLYDGYEEPYYFWEMWVMLRKVLVIFITVFVEPVGELTEVAAALAVTFLATILHLHYQPYEEDDLDTLETFALYASALTLFSGVFFYSDEISSDAADVFFICVIILGNALFVGYFFFAGYNEFRYKIITQLEGINEMYEQVKSKKGFQKGELTEDQKTFIMEGKKELETLTDLVDDRHEKTNELTLMKVHIAGHLNEARKGINEYLHLESDLQSLSAEIARQEQHMGSMMRGHQNNFLNQLGTSVKAFDNGIFPGLVRRFSGSLTPTEQNVGKTHDDEKMERLHFNSASLSFSTASGDKSEDDIVADDDQARQPKPSLHPIFQLYNQAKATVQKTNDC
mmetsp:Transcript_7318/g.9646  ORF Transcript_7318/g.9646 Transcript_7318/m.9646 type:complete len:568 (+) Transcript_7318:2-1705(+)